MAFRCVGVSDRFWKTPPFGLTASSGPTAWANAPPVLKKNAKKISSGRRWQGFMGTLLCQQTHDKRDGSLRALLHRTKFSGGLRGLRPLAMTRKRQGDLPNCVGTVVEFT